MFVLVSRKEENSALFLHKAVLLYCGIFLPDYKSTSPVIQKEEGAPVVKNIPVFVSLSHSEGITLAAVSDSAVGVDIEYRKEREYLPVARRFFGEIPLDLDDFYRLWTAKEAHKKRCGCPLGQALRQKEIKNIRHLPLFKDYTVCIAGEQDPFITLSD
jgi:phosphopantetheinyl transferase